MTSSSATSSTLPGLTGGPKATPDDILLASVASTGSVGAFETLVERYSRRVYALIVRIVGSGADAEELTQDVMMRVFDRAAAFDGRSAVGTWIFRIAYNMAIDHTRREQRRADRPQGNEQSDILADRAAESDADDPMVDVLEEALRHPPAVRPRSYHSLLLRRAPGGRDSRDHPHEPKQCEGETDASTRPPAHRHNHPLNLTICLMNKHHPTSPAPAPDADDMMLDRLIRTSVERLDRSEGLPSNFAYRMAMRGIGRKGTPRRRQPPPRAAVGVDSAGGNGHSRHSGAVAHDAHPAVDPHTLGGRGGRKQHVGVVDNHVELHHRSHCHPSGSREHFSGAKWPTAQASDYQPIDQIDIKKAKKTEKKWPENLEDSPKGSNFASLLKPNRGGSSARLEYASGGRVVGSSNLLTPT